MILEVHESCIEIFCLKHYYFMELLVVKFFLLYESCLIATRIDQRDVVGKTRL